MGLFQKFKDGLRKTHTRLTHEIKRIVTLSPKLTGATLEELEAALLGADLGTAMTHQILAAAKQAYETQGRGGLEVFAVAQREVEKSLSSSSAELRRNPCGLTVVSIVGVNGTGKTTTAAKLAKRIQAGGGTSLLAACDTFRAAAIEQIKLWGQRLDVPVVAGEYGADPAAVAHDAVVAAQARKGLRVKARNRRKNEAFVRQGEWFFLPEAGFLIDEKLILTNEPLRRGNGGKPHWVEFCYRTGGETVYVCSRHSNGVTEAGYKTILSGNPKAKGWGWRVMKRNPGVYVRGRIRHADHATINLNGWHRVLMNTEGQAKAMRNVAFLD